MTPETQRLTKVTGCLMLAVSLGACAIQAPTAGRGSNLRPGATSPSPGRQPSPEGIIITPGPVIPNGACDFLKEGSVKVSVRDAQGRPAAGVEVRVQAVVAPSQPPSSPAPEAARALSCAAPHTGGTRHTDPKGEMLMGSLQPGEYQVSLVGADPNGAVTVTVKDDEVAEVSLQAPAP